MSNKHFAKRHPMDIPHVSAVELPLIVKNEDRAISMLGGKQKISKVINNQNIPNNAPSVASNHPDENVLELRLRNDPFHHPLQSLLTTREKVLLKVSIPKKGLPKDYYDDPVKYSLRELIEENEKHSGPSYKTQPVAIINKTYSFKTMTDFQMSTKNNQLIQQFKQVTNAKTFNEVESFFNQHENLNEVSDFKKSENYQNNDHQLPPPPVFSSVRLPFDFKYQRNPLTTVLKDDKGEIQVLQKRDRLKIHTIMFNFNEKDVPTEPAPELISYYDNILMSDLTHNQTDQSLLRCIEWLKEAFEVKPIWLRKHLADIIPVEFSKSLKQALPYVSYINKTGPWRFCNVKYGIDPRNDKRFWKYQTEYFRVAGLKITIDKNKKSDRLLPLTVEEKNPRSNLKISEHLLFTGHKIPQTITYQLGDLMDIDIRDVISNTPDTSFFRNIIDAKDGWLNRQTIETIRRIVRYKLHSLVLDEPIDPIKVSKIMNTDYTENDEMEVDDDEDAVNDADDVDEDADDDADDDDHHPVDDELIDEQVNVEGINQHLSNENVFENIGSFDKATAAKLKNLVSFVKQDSLN